MGYNKIGQSAVVVIVAIGILMLIYMYFLPVDEKCKLIPSLADCKVSEGNLYVNATPGLLEKQNTAANYMLPEAKIFRQESVDVDSILDNSKASRGWFFSSPAESLFKAQESGESAKLFIFINKAEGKLKVYVNGRKVGVVSGEGVQILELNAAELREDNAIRLVPTAPLFPFFLNDYEIGRVILKERYIMTTNRVTIPFKLGENPKDVLDVKLSFRTRCFTEENLSVYIGDKKIFEDKVCRGVVKDITDLVIPNMTGNITFASEGNYVVREPMLNIRMKEKSWPTYYFNLEKADGPITLKMEFNETGMKKLTAYVNGNALSAETTKKEWKTIINKYLIEDETNSIMLIPEENVIVSRLEVA